MGNRGREIFVPADAVPREVLEVSQGKIAMFRGRAVGSTAGPSREELERERARREVTEHQVAELRAALAAADRDLALTRKELELERARLTENQERERERIAELRAALATAEAALVEARRSWLARLVGQVRDALRR
jgi:chromosome segregation ATPase